MSGEKGQPKISRRDFLDGVAVSVGAGLLGASASGDAEAARRRPYPPSLTGMRGSHEGSFEALHRLRDPAVRRALPAAVDSGERYDLVVVGAGISGLAAAHAFRKARPRARILILDNHDDFGGHAKRNEFTTPGGLRIGYGGSQSISSPAPYSKEAKTLITELGIDVASYAKYSHRELYPSLGLGQAFFFDRETFGTDRLIAHGGGRAEFDDALIAASPLSEAAKRDALRLRSERFDPFPGESEAAKRGRLARMSYLTFLTDIWKVDRSLVPLMNTRTHGLYGVGIDAVPAQDANDLGFAGFQGLGLGEAPGPGQNLDSIRPPDGGPSYFFHFPDGNATLARLLVKQLIPDAMAGWTLERSTTARVAYSRLDRPGEPVRIRLSSPVIRVRHVGDVRNARRVEVVYLAGGRPRAVRARRVVLACWHTTIPHICPDIPAEQREALGFAVKVPVVYTNVAIRNWTAFQRLGVSRITSPAFWHASLALDFPVSIGAYKFPQTPAEPIVVRLTKAACRPGLAARDQHRAGRQELLETPFDRIERDIRSQFDRTLGAGGFDADRDILGITVNRWPHGYSYQYNSLYDDFWLEGRQTPCEVARRPIGRIFIANSDAGAYAYADSAIDHGLRAAREALGRV